PHPPRRTVCEAEQRIRLRQPDVIFRLLEDGDRLLSRGNDLLSPGGVVAEPADEEATKRRVRRERRVSELVRGLCRLVEKDFGPSELADLCHRFGKVGEKLEARGVSLRKQPVRAPKQVGGGPHVAARERATSRGGEPGRTAPTEFETMVVQGAEIRQVLVRLLEVG